MSAARPYLASVQRRLVAFMLDSGILLLTTLLAFGVIDSLGQNKTLLVWIIPILYLAYHATVLTNQSIAFGRVVASISVVSIRGHELTPMQALVRSVSRTVLVALGLTGAVVSHEPWIIIVPCGVEVTLIMVSPWRQSIADLVAGTLVVRSPQVQPHRAPAAPMYSATDSEFGVPPKWRG
jgi:uncharacterized RDD family membrane protein YckC